MSSSIVCGHGIFVLIMNQKSSKVVFGSVVVEFMFKGFIRWRVLSIVWKSVQNARG